MNDHEWHKNRIEELKFHRQIQIDNYNHNQMIYVGLLSVSVVIWIFELQKQNQVIFWITLLGISILLLLFIILKEDKSITQYDEQIRRNYDALLGREK